MKIKKIYFNTIKVTCDKNIEELYYLLKNNSDDFYFLTVNAYYCAFLNLVV